MDVLPRDRSLVIYRRYYVRSELRKRNRTICEVIRELYRDAATRDDPLSMTRLDEAYDMAKRMQRKLEDYAGKSQDPVYLVKDQEGLAIWLSKEQAKERATHLGAVDDAGQLPPTKVVSGLHIPEPDPHKWLVRSGLRDGYPAYQYDRIECALKLCKPERRRTYFDGGAHVGTWTLHLAKHFQAVVAFEPIPINAKCFRLNTAHLDNVTLYQAALGAVQGLVPMHCVNTKKSFSWRVGGSGDVNADCHTIDSLGLTDLDLLKLDVEGSEYEALQGARHTLQRCHPVVVIEEKFDTDQRATNFLCSIGMSVVHSIGHDKILTWR